MSIASAPAVPPGYHRVRWSGDEVHVQCRDCLQFLPATREFWRPYRGFAQCVACYQEASAARQRTRRQDPKVRRAEAEALRIEKRANRDALLEARRAYYRKTRDRQRAQRRARYAARKAA